ncbi:DUF1684 domain-containing protein [soil metagenome]
MTDDAAHRTEVEAWRQGRYAALRRDLGWLTLSGLGWLTPGVNRIGSDGDNDVILPSGPSRAGTVMVHDGKVVADGEFVHDGEQVSGLRMTNDQDGEATLLELGALRICLVERGGRLALRTWDLTSPARAAFDGVDHWPVDPAWRLRARFVPTPGRVLRVPDVLGTTDEQASPGDVTFAVDGERHRLQALSGGDSGELWLVFGDLTNGVETYGGGRFVYAGPPETQGDLIVDFSRAYNPPCVFSPYATCPLPWPANRLPIRVEAGGQAVSFPKTSATREPAR